MKTKRYLDADIYCQHPHDVSFWAVILGLFITFGLAYWFCKEMGYFE